ncbi:MAG: hypothetical protein IH949_02850 [Bacteroidetes bacterium]|nr:hypothetical protein [Bacteroidota bacterium]
MEIRFIRAARTVTGSMHLLKLKGKQFLLDCGLYQGNRKLAFDENEFVNYFNNFEISQLRETFLVHGEFGSQQAFASKLKSLAYNNIRIPERGQIFEI